MESFKNIFDNLPDYILQSKSYQSIGYINSKITELLLKVDYKNDPQYQYLETNYGPEKAKKIFEQRLQTK